jgi:hypothetical protein
MNLIVESFAQGLFFQQLLSLFFSTYHLEYNCIHEERILTLWILHLIAGSMDHVEGIKAEQAMTDSVLGAGVLARLWEFPTGNCIF